MKLYTSTEVARKLGLTIGRINQIALKYNIGHRFGGMRLYTDHDAEVIRKHRGKLGRPRKER